MPGYAIWAAVLVISLIVEGCTSALVGLWFVPSAAVCILLDVCGVKNIYIQLAVFVIISVVTAVLLREKIKQSFVAKTHKTNVDSLVGKIATAESDIPEGEVGRVKINGMSWSAVSFDNRRILAGEKAKVVDISGVKLICAALRSSSVPTEELVGKHPRVESTIDNFSADGTVMCDGFVYPAKGVDSDIIEKNTVVAILRIEDGKAVCGRVSEPVNA